MTVTETWHPKGSSIARPGRGHHWRAKMVAICKCNHAVNCHERVRREDGHVDKMDCVHICECPEFKFDHTVSVRWPKAHKASRPRPNRVVRNGSVVIGGTVARVTERDGYWCRHCGTHENLTLDHIIPVARGGTNEIINLQWLCRPCNTKKGHSIPKYAVGRILENSRWDAGLKSPASEFAESERAKKAGSSVLNLPLFKAQSMAG